MPDYSRREFVRLAAVLTAGLGIARSGRLGAEALPTLAETAALRSADAALRELLAGNARFVAGKLEHPRRQPDDFRTVAERQRPAAVIIGCADSRVPPEVLFDVGIGDLFVVRVAGNIVSGAGAVVKGSIEYAVAELGTPLIMVLGHSRCGAVKAAVEHTDAHGALPGSISALVELIKPAVAQAKGLSGDLLDNAIRANVTMGVNDLKALEPILAGPVKQGRVKVVGAVYDLRTGTVTLVA